MFLPGMNYQDAAWEPTKKALGLVWLHVVGQIGLATLQADTQRQQNLRAIQLGMCQGLLKMQAWLQNRRNNHDRDAYDLATELVMALTAPEGEAIYFDKLQDKLREEYAKYGSAVPERILRKIANDVFADLRDEIDVQGFLAAEGGNMSINYLKNLRKVDQAAHAVKDLLANWTNQREYVSLVLGCEVTGEPKENQYLQKGGRCKAEWLLRWSEHHARFHSPDKKGNPSQGCFHTRSKQFVASIANLEAMLNLIDPLQGRYHPVRSLSHQFDGLHDALCEIRDDVVPDEDHPSRLQKMADPDLAGDDEGKAASAGEEGEDAQADDAGQLDDALPDTLDVLLDGAMAEFDEALAEPAEEQEAAITPEQSDEESESAPGNSELTVISPRFAKLVQLLQSHELALQVGILRDLAKALDDEELADAFEQMGVFTSWGLARDVRLLTDVELARRMPRKENGQFVSPGTVKNRIAKAKLEFMQRVATELRLPPPKENPHA